ncbi:hypothetical protein ASPWEDRAFT_564371 [Aspergillus wentii DTO 134E9]|uniref:EGF-like domain-containing protein n=1 Tax=Aspergillus wentii DTO 134E9 TaxID=1073089 RepID=A0A1L9RH77_ASPWE|nr:uncharacterized protein ASPWEDRAFT_564371 [Aspergillus wentii DTO 134E9]OJJ34193.1 hypothetical protein ASPWEDRAFT_564371 [Aspergillus wentii DTO 134E9]
MHTGPGFGPGSIGEDPQRKGSVRRAREMMQSGRRPPEIIIPDPNSFPEVPSLNLPSPSSSHVTQWPLPDDSPLQTHGRRFVPKGPPPQRPPRPDAPSPSVYSERSAPGAAPSPLHIRRPFPSFSQPLQYQQPPRRIIEDPPPYYSPSSPPGLTPRVSVTTEELFRQSAASSVGSMPSIPDFPFPIQHGATQNYPLRKVAGLAPPSVNGQSSNRRSSVSPIPEELSESPTLLKGSYASSRVIPSWGSAPAESEIFGAYLDVDSDDSQEPRRSIHEDNSALVRQASVGTRGKPSLRTISKPNVLSPEPPPEERAMNTRAAMAGSVLPAHVVSQAPSGQTQETQGPRYSFDTSSAESCEHDFEKAPIFLDTRQSHPIFNTPAYGNDLGGLPRAAPTMSDRRPGGRRPPRLDMNAVRDAEARGSLTSLPDLIRRATKLATNLEHGRTASRNDLLNGGKDPKGPFGHRPRNSGSLHDIISSFPPPRPRSTQGHSSWPIFFRRSTLQNIVSNESNNAHGEKPERRQRRCCGMPLWLFIVVCVVIIIIIAAAVLIPIFLIVVPRENASDLSTCEKTTPCKNGGVSVSSGDICSCVCTNGYTGSQCATAGDAGCITTQINHGSTSEQATMGSELPRLFEDSQNNFSIPLDSVTIMALFSQNNVSCTSENALVSFKGVSSSNKRRFFPIALPAEQSTLDQATSTSTLEAPAQTLAARGSMGIENGIVFDNSETTSVPTAAATTSATKTTQTSTSTFTPTPTSTSTAVSTKVLDFSRIVVLYIFEKTGSLDAALQAEGIVQTYLTGSYSSSNSGEYTLNLSRSGVDGDFVLDFNKFTITMSNGTAVGGN